MRYDRDYTLTIQTDLDEAIVVRPPFNIVFSADKATDRSLNKMNVKIYGLSRERQLNIVKSAEQEQNFEVELKIGYAGNVETIFRGYINVGESSRDGAERPLTLECIDGGFDARFSFTSRTVVNKNPIETILEDMPNTRRGRITETTNLLRPRVLVGNSWKLIREQVNDEEFFIDNGQLNVLQRDEVLNSFTPVVQPSTGLLSTPTVEDGVITFQTMMNPSIVIGGLCQVNSSENSSVNGIYKVTVINYDGEYNGQSWLQTVTAVFSRDFRVVNQS